MFIMSEKDNQNATSISIISRDMVRAYEQVKCKLDNPSI